MAKRLILVLGPETSCTRLWARVFLQAGCFGDGDNFQRMLKMYNSPTATKGINLAILRLSYPHGKWWAPIPKLVDGAKKGGFNDIRVAVTKRDWFCNSAGNIFRIKNIQRAYKMIYGGIAQLNLNYMDVSYESLLTYNLIYVNLILNYFDLPILENLNSLKLKNGNTKHYRRLQLSLRHKKFANLSRYHTLRNFDKMHL